MSESDPPSRDPVRLDERLKQINHARAIGLVSQEEMAVAMGGDASTRLAVYGSLAPGEVNHHHIAALPGDWRCGRVRGRVRAKGWGSHVGFPGMAWTPTAEDYVPVQLFTSKELPAHWGRLDSFEGDDYLRILVPVEGIGSAPIVANLYELRQRDE